MPFLCRTRYSLTVTVNSGSLSDSPGACVGEACEWREPDAWGDPGELVKRKWIRVVDGRGRDVRPGLANRRFRIQTMDRVGALAWDGVEGGEAGA